MPDRAVCRHLFAGLAMLVVGLVLAAGCGEDAGSGGRTGDDISSEVQPCAEIWVLGERLPEDYITCDDGTEGYNPEAGYWHCADGTEVWQEGDSKYFASKGTRIRADKDGALHARLKACGALDGVG